MAKRLPAPARAGPVACNSFAKEYDLLTREIDVPGEDATTFKAYFAEEEPREGRARSSRGVVLLPGAAGHRCPQTRSLAQRLAVFCCALVLVPELRSPAAPKRVAQDVRSAVIFLRADHRVRPLALAGAHYGASQVLRVLSADGPGLAAVAGVAICPPRPQRDELHEPQAPLLILFDGPEDDDTAAHVRAALMPGTGPDDQQQAAAAAAPIVADVQAAVGLSSLTELRKLRVAELRERLASLGLSTTGLKADLVARLHAAAAAASRAPTTPPAPAAGPPPTALDGARRSPGPAPQHEVLQFTGLSAALRRVTDAAEEEEEEEEEEGEEGEEGARDDDSPPAVEIESDSRPGAPTPGEDGLIMAEAWINLHLAG